MAFGGFGAAANPFAAAAAPANPFAPAAPAANPFAPAAPAAANPFALGAPAAAPANPFAPQPQAAANPFAPQPAAAANPFAPQAAAPNPFAPQAPANPFAPQAPAAAPNPFAPQQPAANPFAPAASAAPAAGVFGAPAGAGAVVPSAPGDVQCPLPPGADSISAIAWSPVQGANHIAATSWDGCVRVWEVGRDPATNQLSQAATAGRAEQKVDGVSFLDCAWKEDGSHVFAVGSDHQVRMWNLQANSFTAIGSHAAPIKSCHWVKEAQYLVTAGWDRAVNVWDCRTSTPQGKIALSERVWACDVKYPWLITSTADKKISIYNLQNPSAPYRVFDSPVAHQTRTIRIFHDGKTFAIGTIEGRVAVRYIDQATDTAIEIGTKDKLKNSFSFRCHRQGQLIFPVNCIDAHPNAAYHDVFATAGADGLVVFWNKAKKMKLKEYPHLLGKHTISALAFNAPGDLCAYTASYDWSKGPDGYNLSQQPTTLMVHAVTPEDVNGTPTK